MSSSSGEDSGSREIEICRIQSPDRREDKEECVNHEQDKKVFNIAQEIMTSERDYVESLCLINVDFKDFLDAARSETKSDIIPEKDLSRIFSNLLELQMLNVDLLRDFESRVENWSTCPMIADVIVRKGDFLKLYTSYVQDFQQTSEAFICCCDRYPAFGRLVEDFEALDKCRKLKVTHFMLKPVQRLPQYKLLLEEYSKNLSPSSQDFSNAVEALAIVKKAADHVNRKMKQNVRAIIYYVSLL